VATVYSIVKQSQCYIDVTSEPRRGSRFTLYLPRVGQPVVELETPNGGTPPFARQNTIMVVEDEKGIRNLITLVWQDQGYQILAAADGIEARQGLQMLKGTCSLVTTDVTSCHE